MSEAKPDPAKHPTIAAFGVEENCLTVGGLRLTRLAERVGTTPFFAYDRALIDARVAHLRRHLPESVRLSYAVKANPMPAVIQHLAGTADGFDVASALEMKAALDTPMDAQRVSFAGPGKTGAELAQAVAAGVVVHVESPAELPALSKAGEALGLRPKLAIRVNPDFQIKGSGMRMGGGAQQFGIDAEQVPDVLGKVAARDLEFLGFHIFAGSQNLNAEALIETQKNAILLAAKLAEGAPGPVRHLNIGGGFGIPYFAKERSLDLGPIGEALSELMQKVVKPRLPEAAVIVELGRYIVGEAGVYVCRVLDKKRSRGKLFLITDGGLHHQLAASGNFGQVVRRNFPVAIGNRMGASQRETVSVVGCLCTPLDILCEGVDLPSAEVGDLVVVFQAGAYGLTASPTAFLGHPVPQEVLV